MATVDKTATVGEERVSYVEDTIRAVRDNALVEAREKLGAFRQDETVEALLARAGFMDRFKYALASGVAATLAANDKRVQEVYTYDPSAVPDSEGSATLPVDPAVHLLVKVSAASAALDAFVASLDRALTASLKELPSPVFTHREFILDVVVIDDEDVRLRRGPAAVITSVFAPALKIWERAD
jgi:hypothetical protein